MNINNIDFTNKDDVNLVSVGISNRHLHVSKEDLKTLFGENASLTVKKELSQPGQFAAEETVTLVGPKGELKKVRILGPERKQTQVEISQTEARNIGLTPPLRESGDLKGSSPIKIIGPAGEVDLEEGCIIAKTHIHLSTDEAKAMNLQDKERVTVYFKNEEKSGCLYDVVVRVSGAYAKDLHVDTDEANAFRLKNLDLAYVAKQD